MGPRQSNWTGYAHQSPTLNGLGAAASIAYATDFDMHGSQSGTASAPVRIQASGCVDRRCASHVFDMRERTDVVVDYAPRTGEPPRPPSGQSREYDGHSLRRNTSTERRQWMSHVNNEVPLPKRYENDRLEPRMADLSLRPQEQSRTFRENVTATATQTESTEPF